MRMWLDPPRAMCWKHLLDEHRTLHAIKGMLQKEQYDRLQSYLNNGMIDLTVVVARHKMIQNEMERRGFNHKSPLAEIPELPKVLKKVGRGYISLATPLVRKCDGCKEQARQ